MTNEIPVPTAGPPPSPTRIEERLHPLTPFVNLWIGVVALGWFVVSSVLQGDPIWNDLGEMRERLQDMPWWVFLVAGGVVIGLGTGYWSWWTTRFVIDDQEFRLENTGAFQESKRIAFSRIQSVDVTQPFAARLLGLAQVKIDVGADDGATLSFLKRSRATEIRDYLMTRATGRTATTSEPGREASAWDDTAQGDQVLARLNPGEIILSAFATMDIWFLMLAFAVPWVLGWLFDWSVLAWGGGMAGLALAILGSLSKRLFGQFNYTLARTPAGLRITRGLFTLRSQTIPVHRVQAVETRQPLLWRWLGRARLDITVLGLGGEDSESLSSSTIYLPFGTPAQVQVALAAIWPGLRLEELRFTRTPERARWLDPLQWQWMGFAVDDQVLVVRRGWLHRRQIVVPHARLQSVELSQGPFERRLGLASVTAKTTDLMGMGAISHLDAPHARALALAEMDRARAARVDELLDPPGLRTAAVEADPAGVVLVGVPDIWTPATAPLPTSLPAPVEVAQGLRTPPDAQ